MIKKLNIMKRYISFFLLFAAIVYSVTLHAQFDPRPQVQMPIGDAQSLGKFGEIPVDLFTGRVNIDIPIYTIKYYDIEVPISISYHGGGIKVSDERASVGLGWTLNAGGVINRIVRGMPDELFDNQNKVAGYNKLNNLTLNGTLSQFHEFIDLIKQRKTYLQKEPSIQGNSFLLNPHTDEEFYIADMVSKYGEAYDNGHFDTALDNYNFNVQGLSGAFVHEGNNIILQCNDGVTINNNVSDYTIKDANGYVYQFQVVEKQTYSYKINYDWNMTNWENLPKYYFKYPSSWWLSSITSPTGEVVNFYYNDAKIVYRKTTTNGYTQIMRPKSTTGFYYNYSEFNDYEYPPGLSKARLDTVYKKVLSRIETPNCIVRFSYWNPPVSSHTLSPQLNAIEVYANSGSRTLIEETKFTYTGTGSKARLLQLKKRGVGHNKEQTHLFSYHSTAIDPPTTTNDVRRDHWGYFAPKSTGYFSQKKYFGTYPIVRGSLRYFKDRYADNTTADNDMLSQITYPTGGTTEFVWEPHTYSELSTLGSSAPLDRTSEEEIVYDPQYMIEKTFSLCGKSENQILTTSCILSSPRIIMIDFSMYYPVMDNLQEHVCPNHCISGWDDGDKFTQNTIGDRTHIRIKKDGQVIRVVHICKETYKNLVTIDATTGTYSFELCNPRDNFNRNCAQCDLYYTDYFNRYGIDTSNYGYITIEIGDLISSYDLSYKNVGGVRIKRITNKSANNITLIKEYDYIKDHFDSNSSSSGVLAYPPRYASLFESCEYLVLEDMLDVPTINCNYLLTLRSNGLPYTLNGGSHIEYSKVVETVVQKADLLFNHPNQKPIQRTVYSYWTGADLGCSDIDDTDSGIFVPSDMLQLTSQNHRRGHLKEKIEYTDEIRTTKYQYQIFEPQFKESITGSVFTVEDYVKTPFRYFNNKIGHVKPYKDLGIVQYHVTPYNKRLLSISSEGTKSNNYQQYTYANKAYSIARAANAPSSHSIINSEGDTITQYFTYVNINLNRIHTCVTVKGKKIIDAYRNEYDSQGRIIRKYVALLNPQSLPLANNYNPVNLTNELAESYLYYRNRLAQFTNHRSSLSTVYLWSYRNAYPVAEIQNATFDNVCNILGDDILNRLQYDNRPDMNLLNGLRTIFPESMISTMTYEMLVGITSFTDPKGATTYYDYNSFGQLKECYIIENGQKKIVQKKEYHWSH